MFSKQERRKSKYKFGGTKVCKAEKVRKYFVYRNIEDFLLVCKLHYLQFGFQIYRSSRLQLFFGTGALKNLAMLEFFVNKVADFQACNFIKKRLKHWCFSAKFAKSLRASILHNTSGGCFWKHLLNFPFILFHIRMMNRVIAWYVLAAYRLFHFIACHSFLFISIFFLSFLLNLRLAQVLM